MAEKWGVRFRTRMVGGVTDVVAGVPSVLLQDGYVALQGVLGADKFRWRRPNSRASHSSISQNKLRQDYTTTAKSKNPRHKCLVGRGQGNRVCLSDGRVMLTRGWALEMAGSKDRGVCE